MLESFQNIVHLVRSDHIVLLIPQVDRTLQIELVLPQLVAGCGSIFWGERAISQSRGPINELFTAYGSPIFKVAPEI